MPPSKSIKPLKELTTSSLAASISCAIECITRGRKKPPEPTTKSGRKKKTSKSKLRQIAEEPTIFNPYKELEKVKRYLGEATPKKCRINVFHETLLSVTYVFTEIGKEHFSGDSAFLEKVKLLENALRFTFDLIFDPDITILDMTKVLHEIMKWVDVCRLNNRDPLARTYSYGQVESMLLAVLGANTQVFSSLACLVWPHLVSGELIKMIGRYCRNLRRLVLTCSCDIITAMDEDVQPDFTGGKHEKDIINALSSLYKRSVGDFASSQPVGCPWLKTLILPELDDSENLIVSVMVEALCSLRSLEHVSGIPMLSCLVRLPTIRGSPNKLNLKNLCDQDTYRRRFVPDVTYFKDLLPKVESVEIIVSKHITTKIMPYFEDIRHLRVEWPDFHIHAKKYSNLHTLDIALDFQGVWPMLLALSRSCRELKELTLQHPTFEVSEEHQTGVRPPKMPSLRSLRIIRSSYIEFTAFRTFVQCCPNLEVISLTLSNDRNYLVDEFSDHLIRSIAPLLKNVRSFTAECQYKYNLYLQLNCTLTSISADTLIAHCPNLKYIGNLDCWDVNETDVNNLFKKIKVNNWDLVIG